MARAKNEEFNQIKYQNEFKKANYDRVEILVKKRKRSKKKNPLRRGPPAGGKGEKGSQRAPPMGA